VLNLNNSLKSSPFVMISLALSDNKLLHRKTPLLTVDQSASTFSPALKPPFPGPLDLLVVVVVLYLSSLKDGVQVGELSSN
jgi:hypothetical protein